jgi:hypothetical protein
MLHPPYRGSDWGNVESRQIQGNVKRFLGFGADKQNGDWENGVEDNPDEVDEKNNHSARHAGCTLGPSNEDHVA